MVKASIVLFLSEVLREAIQEEEANEPLFRYITSAFDWLDSHQHFANFHIYFLLKLTQYLGFYPDNSVANATYFNSIEGSFQNNYTNSYCEKGEHIHILQRFFGIKIEAISQIKMNKTLRLEVVNLLITYYELHIQGFKKPKSLAILNQLFS
jgi:DNA repair protein RecO (recombination protein O)